MYIQCKKTHSERLCKKTKGIWLCSPSRLACLYKWQCFLAFLIHFNGWYLLLLFVMPSIFVFMSPRWNYVLETTEHGCFCPECFCFCWSPHIYKWKKSTFLYYTYDDMWMKKLWHNPNTLLHWNGRTGTFLTAKIDTRKVQYC